MALDPVVNFAKGVLSTGYSAAATSITLNSGNGARFPASTPFNAVWWNASDYPDPADDPNVEIVTVTAVSGDTFTVTRGAESTSASAKNTSGRTYKLVQAPTAKTISDLAALSVSAANPSASIGLAAVNGSSPHFMRADAAPPLDQSIAPTWTGLHTFNAGLSVAGAGLVAGSPTGGDKGAGTVNAITLYQNGTALAASATTNTTNASNISSGTLASARGGAGTISGLLKANGAGLVSAATAGTDYAPATSGSAILKGDSAGGFSAASAGADYLAPPSGSALLKANAGGALANAVSGTDYAPATSGSSILKGNGSGGFSSAVAGTDYAGLGNTQTFTAAQTFSAGLNVLGGFTGNYYNGGGAYPSTSNTGSALGWNFTSGYGEVDLWNTYTSAGKSFNFYQMTGVGAATLLATLGPGLQLGAPTGGDKGAGTLNAASPIYVNGTAVMQPNVTNTLTVGYTFTAYNAGTYSSGTFTPAPANGNYQYATNNGAFSLAAPSSDCAIDIMVTNGASAGAITFSGFTVGSNTGDTYATTNTYKFILSIRRINGTSTYVWKALQ